MRLIPLASFLVLAVGGSGCWGTGGSDPASGRVTFQFANNGGDLPTHPVAAGGARTQIEASGPHFNTVTSSDPSVATFAVDGTVNSFVINVVSGVPGTTKLEVFDESNRLLGSDTVIVAAAAQLTINHGWTDGTTPTIVAGTSQVLHVVTVGSDGNSTRGDGAVTFALAGDLMPAEVPVDGDAIGFVGALDVSGGASTGTITASCPNAVVTQSFAFVPPSAVTGLVTTAQNNVGGVSVVSAVPFMGQTPVYAEPCVWSASDPSVTLQSQVSGLELSEGVVGIFNLTRPGTFTVTCAMAGQTATATVSRTQ